MKALGIAALTGVSLLAVTTSAFAQEAAPVESEAAAADEIVVTGTLIRGIAPGGSQTIAVDQEQIEAIGASSTQQLLTNLPSSGVFLNIASIEGRNNTRLTVNRPSLRNLGSTSSATSATLLLVDGHRMPGMGIRQNSPDIDSIAPGAIERIEVVTDGGSSIYGSDAVGGVINLITRRDFDGIDARARYGFGDDYQEVTADLTVGKKWDGGSAFVSYNFAWHDSLYGRDRDYVRRLDYVTLPGSTVGLSFQCNPGNVVIAGGANYPLSGAAVPLGALTLTPSSTLNRCDTSDDTTFLPSETRHSVFGGIMLDSGGPVSFALKGYYMHRVNTSDAGPFRSSVTLNPTLPAPLGGGPNPFYRSINGSTTAETVQFSLAPIFGNSNFQRTTASTWAITPSVKWDLGSRWQLNALFTYGEGYGLYDGRILNSATLPTAAALGQFDPFNLGAPGNAAILTTAQDWFDYGRATNKLTNTRAVVDGPLLALPGGDLKVAVGGEYSHEFFGAAIQNATAAGIASIPFRTASRNVYSLFGEVNIPVIGDGNRGMFYALSLSASGRWDHYSDVGGTFNPKFGINFAPVEWLKLRGTWGKSFQAPGLADSPIIQPPTFSNLSTVVFGKPGLPGTSVNPAFTQVFLGGVVEGLQPQKATTWSLGFDIDPPFVDGLSAGMTYYNIKFTDQIGIIPIFNPTLYYPGFVGTYATYDQGIAAIQAKRDELVAIAVNPSVATAVPLANLYSIGDGRARNLSATHTSGLDFYVRYRQETGFGSVFFNWSGNYILNFDQQLSPLLPFQDITDLSTRLRMTTSIGADVGNLNGQITWIHSGGFETTPAAANLNQSRVGSYNIINLYLNYDVPGDGVLGGLSFNLGVDNLFDTAPPPYNGSIGNFDGYGNAFNIGRVVKLGVGLRFGGDRREPASESAFAPPPPPPPVIEEAAPPPPPPPPPPARPGERG